MNSLTVTLPWPDAALSPNGRAHHMARARAAKKARVYAWGMAKAAMGPLGIRAGTWIGPVTVQWTFHPEISRDRDDDNFVARMKASRDGIADALGLNDTGFTTLPAVFGEKRKPACVVVTLTAAAVGVPMKGEIR